MSLKPREELIMFTIVVAEGNESVSFSSGDVFWQIIDVDRLIWGDLEFLKCACETGIVWFDCSNLVGEYGVVETF